MRKCICIHNFDDMFIKGQEYHYEQGRRFVCVVPNLNDHEARGFTYANFIAFFKPSNVLDRDESVELTTMVKIEDDGYLLLQKKTKGNYKGYVFPGGHVEPRESIVECAIRETKEETGLDIINPILCGVKQFQTKTGRYLVFLFSAITYGGELKDSPEGKMAWFSRKEIDRLDTVDDFNEILEVFDDRRISEYIAN